MKRAILLSVFACLTIFFGVGTFQAEECSAVEENDTITEKTLVVWATPADLNQSGGSVLTLNHLPFDQFDAVVFAELTSKVWMPGSNGFHRTNKEQSTWPRETKANELVQLAVVHRGKVATLYRNGHLVDEYPIDMIPTYRLREAAILFGQRHYHQSNGHFTGKIRDARIYDTALDESTIAAMEPGKPIAGIEPWCWWDFASSGTCEKTGRFNRVELSPGVTVDDGCLVLTGNSPRMLATSTMRDGRIVAGVPREWSKEGAVPESVVASTRLLREKLLDDPYRPGYHFAISEDNGVPGDPNGCFYANGRYHLMYLYARANAPDARFSWGHISSKDLIHWRHHSDSIGPTENDGGCFSGGAFLDDDGAAYLTYWMLWGRKGIGMAKSTDRHYDSWEKFENNPVIESTEIGVTELKKADGSPFYVGSADPSNIWKKSGNYYMLCGNLPLLDKLGRKGDFIQEYRGDRLYLFESSDLIDWDYKHEFYTHNMNWTAPDEDNMCPSFWPLPSSPDGGAESGKHLLLFISHNRGCQYYVGTYDTDNDRFLPENHGRMTWVDNTYFAPESLIDDKGRHIMWAWLVDNVVDAGEAGWSGVFGLPRTLWVGDDGTLRMRPVPELELLRYHPQEWNDIQLTNAFYQPDVTTGESCELQIDFCSGNATQKGVIVRASADLKEQTLLYYDSVAKELVFDSTQSGDQGRKAVERAPFELKEGEPLSLRVFVDKSVVEVYANDRQAICRRVYPKNDSVNIVLFTNDGDATINAKAWEMMPANPH